MASTKSSYNYKRTESVDVSPTASPVVRTSELTPRVVPTRLAEAKRLLEDEDDDGEDTAPSSNYTYSENKSPSSLSPSSSPKARSPPTSRPAPLVNIRPRGPRGRQERNSTPNQIPSTRPLSPSTRPLSPGGRPVSRFINRPITPMGPGEDPFEDVVVGTPIQSIFARSPFDDPRNGEDNRSEILFEAETTPKISSEPFSSPRAAPTPNYAQKSKHLLTPLGLSAPAPAYTQSQHQKVLQYDDGMRNAWVEEGNHKTHLLSNNDTDLESLAQGYGSNTNGEKRRFEEHKKPVSMQGSGKQKRNTTNPLEKRKSRFGKFDPSGPFAFMKNRLYCYGFIVLTLFLILFAIVCVSLATSIKAPSVTLFKIGSTITGSVTPSGFNFTRTLDLNFRNGNLFDAKITSLEVMALYNGARLFGYKSISDLDATVYGRNSNTTIPVTVDFSYYNAQDPNGSMLQNIVDNCASMRTAKTKSVMYDLLILGQVKVLGIFNRKVNMGRINIAMACDLQLDTLSRTVMSDRGMTVPELGPLPLD